MAQTCHQSTSHQSVCEYVTVNGRAGFEKGKQNSLAVQTVLYSASAVTKTKLNWVQADEFALCFGHRYAVLGMLYKDDSHMGTS